MKYITLNHNQINLIEEGAFENNKDLLLLDISYNNLTSIYNLTVGLEVNMNHNLLTKIHVSSSFTKLEFVGNLVTSLSCSVNPSMQFLDGSNNALKSMNCIKTMTNLTTLLLSNNNFTQLVKTAFTQLTKLQYLEIYKNPIKTLKSSVFGPLIQLRELYVDHLTLYKTLRTVLPNIEKLGVTSKTWNCTKVETVAGHVNALNIKLSFNSPDLTDFVCQKDVAEINKI